MYLLGDSGFHLNFQIIVLASVGLSFIRRTGVVLLLLLFASFVFLLLSQLLSCALLNLYFRICTLYLLEYDCTVASNKFPYGP